MNPQHGFPTELLQQPVAQRLAYFETYTMAHPKLVEAAQKLMYSIQQPAGSALIFIFGPTGVGKSTLLRRVSQKLIEASLLKLETDKDYIPVAGIEVAAPEFGNFDWKDFYVRALMALQEPLIEKKISHTTTKLKLRLSLEKALQYRRPDVFYLDEAQNLGKVASGRKLRDQTDCIKSLASMSGVRFLLCGTYELLMLRNLSAQLCRRSTDIHFSRYLAESDLDVKIFQSVVQSFQLHLPLAQTPDLVSYWDFCYERSIGCVGILKDWLSRTLNGVLSTDANASTLSIQNLEQYAWSLEQCMIMLTESREEEKKLTDLGVVPAEFRAVLGLKPSLGSHQNTTAQEITDAPNKRSCVGKPLPKRRPVGGI